MFYSLRGMAVGVAAVAMLSGWAAVNRSMNWSEAKATVDYIDRTCDFVETTYEGKKAVSARGYTDTCNSTDEWEKVKQKHKKVSGRATVHLSYSAPTDGSYRTGELKLTGRDEDFYTLKAGSTVGILVSKTEPTRIRKA